MSKDLNTAVLVIVTVFAVISIGAMVYGRSDDMSYIWVEATATSDQGVYYEIYLDGEMVDSDDVDPGEKKIFVLFCSWGMLEFGEKESTVLLKATIGEETYSESQKVKTQRYQMSDVEFKF